MGKGEGAAIVTTLRNAGASLDSFITYHLAIGFSRLYLFFDDKNDPDIARAAAHANVTVIPHDEKLRQAWATLSLFTEHEKFVDSEVMSRQVLNVEYAMALACVEGIAWLLHIDSDELFYAPGTDAAQHFAWLDTQDCDAILYKNYEALPERESIGDVFQEVTLFKVPPYLPRGRHYAADELRPVIAMIPQFQPNFFHFYNSGKSAVRLASSGMVPAGVHGFTRGAPRKIVEARAQAILHYACCGFDTFWTKYQTLGRFADTWWGAHEIARAIGTFHLEARDVVATGDVQKALAFYNFRMALNDEKRVAQFIAQGILSRIEEPVQILAARFWQGLR